MLLIHPGYLCICTGLVSIFIAVFVLLSQRYRAGQSRLRFIPIVANMLVGVGITLLSTMTLTGASLVMMQEAWSLPALMIVFHTCKSCLPRVIHCVNPEINEKTSALGAKSFSPSL